MAQMPQPQPPVNLTSVYAKLDRAEEHLKTLTVEIQAWAETNPYEICANEQGIDCTRFGITANRVGPKPDLMRWTLIAGDVINNLRCALDHTIYSIAKSQTASQPSADIEKLSFVLSYSRDKFMDRNNLKRLAHLSRPVVDSIESIQPYNRVHPHYPPLLGILRDFSNADKHRLLRLAGAAVIGTNITFLSPAKGAKFLNISPEPLDDSTIVAVIETSEPDPNFVFQFGQISFCVALWHGLRKGDTNVLHNRTECVGLITDLASEVRFAIAHVLDAV